MPEDSELISESQIQAVEKAFEDGDRKEIRDAIEACLKDLEPIIISLLALRWGLVGVVFGYGEGSKTSGPSRLSLQALLAAAMVNRGVLQRSNSKEKRSAAYAAAYAAADDAAAAYAAADDAAAAYAAADAAAADDAAAAYAAYADVSAVSAVSVKIIILQDLILVASGKDLSSEPLALPDLSNQGIDDFWLRFLFEPAVKGSLFKDPSDLDFKGLDEALLAWFSDEKNYKADSTRDSDGNLAVGSADYFRDYLIDHMAGELQSTGTARLVLLGNGGAGKTSLVNCLHDARLVDYEDATPRISVTDLLIKKGEAFFNDPSFSGPGLNGSSFNSEGKHDITLSVWDFGGQVIMHSTHHFFLNQGASYAVLCNQRANEQPDAWLSMLRSRFKLSGAGTVNDNDNDKADAREKAKVFVVYTHCGTLAKPDSDTHTDSDASHWSRQNSLQRRFGQFFDLAFHHVDLDPALGECLSESTDPRAEPIKQLVAEIKQRAVTQEAGDKFAKSLGRLTEVFSDLEQPYLSVASLALKLGSEPRDWARDYLTIAMRRGLVFPEKAISAVQLLALSDEDLTNFKVVLQRHWLTYGVYFLINSAQVQKSGGLLRDEDINDALRVGETWFVDNFGYPHESHDEIADKASDDSAEPEQLIYREEAVGLLKSILLNYKWAVTTHRRFGEILLPLAARLDEPDVAKTAYEYLSAVEPSEDCEYLELVFKLAPSDFFFRLVTYLEPHLNADQLWRTGTILHFYGRRSTYAVIEFAANTLRLKVKGTEQTTFRHLLLSYIADNIVSYQSRGHKLSTHMSERMKVNLGEDDFGRDRVEYHVVQTQLLESLLDDDNDLLDKLKNTILKRGMTVTNNIINNNGNMGAAVQGSGTIDMREAQVGDGNTKITIENVQFELGKLLEALNRENQAAPSELAELKAVVEEVQQSKAPSKSLLEKTAGVFKNFETIANASQSLQAQLYVAAAAISHYLPSIS